MGAIRHASNGSAVKISLRAGKFRVNPKKIGKKFINAPPAIGRKSSRSIAPHAKTESRNLTPPTPQQG